MATAAAKLLPPGAAQASSTRIPASSSAASTAAWAAGSWTKNSPFWNASSRVMSPARSSARPACVLCTGTMAVSSCSLVRQVFTWIYTGGSVLSAWSTARAPS